MPLALLFSTGMQTKRMDFWLVQEYIPEIATLKTHVPGVDQIAAGIGATRVETVWVPHDCSDGFLAAYWRRPERYLEPDVRGCISALAQFDQSLVARGIASLARDLESGVWHERHADDLTHDVMDWGYRLVVCDPWDWQAPPQPGPNSHSGVSERA